MDKFQPELVSTLKRTASGIFNKGGIIRKLENLGTRDIPYKTSKHGLVHKQASYFIFQFNAPPSCLEDLTEEYSRDIDIVRQRVYRIKEEPQVECTLADELQPAPYRKDVQDLISQAKKLDKPKFSYNSGLDYYPFQKWIYCCFSCI